MKHLCCFLLTHNVRHCYNVKRFTCPSLDSSVLFLATGLRNANDTYLFRLYASNLTAKSSNYICFVNAFFLCGRVPRNILKRISTFLENVFKYINKVKLCLDPKFRMCIWIKTSKPNLQRHKQSRQHSKTSGWPYKTNKYTCGIKHM